MGACTRSSPSSFSSSFSHPTTQRSAPVTAGVGRSLWFHCTQGGSQVNTGCIARAPVPPPHPTPPSANTAGSEGQEERKLQCVCPLVLSLTNAFIHSHTYSPTELMAARLCLLRLQGSCSRDRTREVMQHPPATRPVHVPAPTKGQVSSLLCIPPHSPLEGLGPYNGSLLLSASLVLPFSFITSVGQQTCFVTYSFKNALPSPHLSSDPSPSLCSTVSAFTSALPSNQADPSSPPASTRPFQWSLCVHHPLNSRPTLTHLPIPPSGRAS